MNIFVGNLSFEATGDDLKKLFGGYGNVASAVIVMRKEKKTPKSRGFGFVELPDEQQALAAIAALNGKEFMGRVINVNPTRPKKGAQAASGLKEKGQSRVMTEDEQYPGEEREKKNVRGNLTFRKPGAYKGGRRTRSYMIRRGLDGMQEETKPRRRSQDNPMRWRKRHDQSRPWLKSSGGHKPWNKAEEGVKPWKKAGDETKPWHKSEGGSKPWNKTVGKDRAWSKPGEESKSWRKPAGKAKPWHKSEGGIKPWKKPAGDAKPWKKPAGDAKPWKRPAGDAKPWSKSSRRPHESGFNPSTSLGMVRGNSESSRTKGRRKPGGYKR